MRIPPVRQPAPLHRVHFHVARESFQRLFPGTAMYLVGSGTQALALAISTVLDNHAPRTAEVVIPAYGCPDLIAACLYAGVSPRLVDVAVDRWGYDPADLEARLSKNTAALVAVNLLGIGDDALHLHRLAATHGVSIIADSAQHLAQMDPAQQRPHADCIVLSFGRGKPLNALRGGMLITSRELPSATVGQLNTFTGRLRELALNSRLAALMFNLATHPLLYDLIERLPGLNVGTTRFHPLSSITALPARAWSQVGAALQQYLAEPSDNLRVWRPYFDEWSRCGITLLRSTEGPVHGRHLRLPLLAQDREHRDRLLAELQRQGCGATFFYGAPLPSIDSVPDVVARQGPFPNATRLADRLLTLPTHAHVTERIAERVTATIRALAGH